jgi:hypothetical protein
MDKTAPPAAERKSVERSAHFTGLKSALARGFEGYRIVAGPALSPPERVSEAEWQERDAADAKYEAEDEARLSNPEYLQAITFNLSDGQLDQQISATIAGGAKLDHKPKLLIASRTCRRRTRHCTKENNIGLQRN